MLRWDVGVEGAAVILGHNVEYTGSMSKLLILVPECSKGSHPEGGGACQIEEKFGLFRG